MSDRARGHGTSDGAGDQTADQRDREADDREGALNTRETDVEAREVEVTARELSRARRMEDARDIRAQADERDMHADERDWDAGTRDMAANAQSWLLKDDKDGRVLAGREAGQRDRGGAKADRMSAAVDRALLSEDDDPRDGEAAGTVDR